MRRVRLLNVARRFCSTTKVEESFEDKIYKNQLRKYPNVATKGLKNIGIFCIKYS